MKHHNEVDILNRRDINKARAAATLNTIKEGFYKLGNQNIMLPNFKPAEYFSTHKLDNLPKIYPKETELSNITLEVRNESTVDTILREYRKLYDQDKETEIPIGVLNFASARHPGGGFLNGAMAQEEALCHASTLYPQLKDSKMYEYNNAMCNSGIYNDAMNVSKTIFFKNGNDYFVRPAEVIVVTSAAVNNRALKPYERSSVEYAMRRRMEKIIQMFIRNKCKVLILGAFGCGVFGNNSEFIAKTWKELLEKYGGYFDKVVFTILDSKGDNIKPFKELFE